MSDTTGGEEMRLRAAAMTDDESVSDDTILHDDSPDPRASTGDEPTGPGTAGDSLGGAEAPTGNDATMGADAPTGDAGLAEAPDPDQAGEGTTP
ncbi:MAG TPA: hypothetical protein VGO65_07480 [Pseudolysinimonas sp.]|jgi:hypothetical protein|nr:hypothetical protein [Pseudolysinimonas sp.]